MTLAIPWKEGRELMRVKFNEGWTWLALLLIPITVLAVALQSAKYNGTRSGSYLQPQALYQGYEGTELEGSAPDFRLIDQNEARVVLSDFRGKVIVLTFLDSRCQDVCPLTALHLRLAYERMKREGVDAAQVVFLGVNVNIEANTPQDVMEFSKEYGVTGIPTWHFLTGTAEELKPVWEAYDITVLVRDEGEVVHTPGVYLIDQEGQKRWYVSTPLYDENPATAWTGPVLSDLLVKQIKPLLKTGVD